MHERWLRSLIARLIRLARWLEQHAASLLELYTAGFVLLCELRLLLLFLEERWLRFWVRWLGVIFPAMRLTTAPLPPMLFWWGFPLLLALMGLPALAYAIATDGLTRIRLWSRDPNGQALRVLRRQQALLAHLHVLAQEEQERHERTHPLPASAAPTTSASRPFNRYAGLFSLAFVSLSSILSIPASSLLVQETSIVQAPQTTPPLEDADPREHEPEALAAPNPPASTKLETDQHEAQAAHEDAPTLNRQEQGEIKAETTPYRLFLFGNVQITLVGTTTVEVRFKSQRIRELLAYLALPARAKEIGWQALVAAIYEARLAEDAPSDTQQDVLYNDVKAVRKQIKVACARAGLPYVNPVEVTGYGQGACYRLADAYAFTDVAHFEQVVQALKTHQPESENAVAHHVRRSIYQDVLSRAAQGFLGQFVPEQRTGRWAISYYHRYKVDYHHLLWDLAEQEYALSQTQQGEERQRSLHQAASLYEQCALLTGPTSKEELAHGDQARLSEQALRQCLLSYSQLDNLTQARHTYSHYIKTLKRRSLDWKPEPQTVQVFEEITRLPAVIDGQDF